MLYEESGNIFIGNNHENSDNIIPNNEELSDYYDYFYD